MVWECIICSKKLPINSLKKETRGQTVTVDSDYGYTPVRTHFETFFDQSKDFYLIRIDKKYVEELKKYALTSIDNIFQLEKRAIEDDVNKNILKDEYRQSILKQKTSDMSEKYDSKKRRILDFLEGVQEPFKGGEIGRSFETEGRDTSVYYPGFGIHSNACLEELLKNADSVKKENYVMRGQKEKLLKGKITVGLGNIPEISPILFDRNIFKKPQQAEGKKIVIELNHVSEY